MCASTDGHVHGEALPAGTLKVSLLPDGRIKIDTGSFAGPAHASAQAAIPAIAQALGVDIETAKRRVAHAWNEAKAAHDARHHHHNKL